MPHKQAVLMEAPSCQDLFSQLHHSVQVQVLSHLDSRTLSHVSCTCKELRHLALSMVSSVRVPGEVTGKELLSFTGHAFPAASQLTLRGDHLNLRPAELTDFLRSPGPWNRFTRLVVSELQLTLPLPVTTVTIMCNLWSHLRELTFHDTRLTCPLDCTEPVAIDNLLRRLYAMEDKPLPHMTVFRQLVNKHEAELHANLLVTSKVCTALSQLPQLTRATLTSRFLHLHNEAVAALQRCTALSHLTLQLSDQWPTVTAHGLCLLPGSLRVLRLISNRPLETWQSLAALTNPDTVEVPGNPNTQPNHSPHPQLAWAPTALEPSGGSCPGRHGITWRPLLEVQLEGVLGGQDSQLPAGGLPSLPALTRLSLRSSCKEAPAPEDPEEVVPDNPLEVEEAKAMRVMLGAAPRLAELELSNAGPVLTRTLTQLAKQVPSQRLVLSCHSRVDACPLIAAQPRAQLSLTLKGVSATQLQDLVQSAEGQLGGRLTSLHFQRSHELSDTLLASALETLTHLNHLSLTTCRQVTCDLVVEAARLRRPIRLRVTSCRLVSARGWEKAVLAAREVPGSSLVDVKYPNEDDVGNEVAFE